jgi:hypothetical protein
MRTTGSAGSGRWGYNYAVSRPLFDEAWQPWQRRARLDAFRARAREHLVDREFSHDRLRPAERPQSCGCGLG